MSVHGSLNGGYVNILKRFQQDHRIIAVPVILVKKCSFLTALHLRLTLRYFDELFCFLWHNIGYRIRDLIQNSFIFKKVRTESQSERDLKIAGSDLNRTKENEARPKAWSTQTDANKEQSREKTNTRIFMVERRLVRVQHAKRMLKQTQLHCIISSLIHQLLHFRKCVNLEFFMCKLS